MRWLTGILLLICLAVSAQEPVLRRVCQDPVNNTLYWSNPVYPCANFHFYIIWGSFDSINFFPVDTNFDASAESHVHQDANTSSGTPNKFYYVERRDSCTPPFVHNSGILKVDVENYAYSYLDSVSVDINTNIVHLGWHSNTSPDFNRYFTYKFDGTYISLNTSGTKDTFELDLTGSNPSAGPLQYDMNTSDSCGNPSIFGTNPHRTIHLTYTTDTCKKTVELRWSPYVGWMTRKYYIYEDAGSGMVLIDSTESLSYTRPIVLGRNTSYYIRAYKDTFLIVSSSSNKISFTTRGRTDPSYLTINYLSTQSPFSQNLFLQFDADQAGETKEFLAEVFDSLYTKTTELRFSSADINNVIDLGLNGRNRYHLQLSAINFCNLPSLKSDSSTNIVLRNDSNHSFRLLRWNPYFTWNTGVETYNIYRGTGESDTYSFSLWKSVTDTSTFDSSEFQNQLSYGICYYVEAKKQGEEVFSRSNIVCSPGELTVHIPNAFTPDGYNTLFKPEGISIDYNRSIMEIYDRWGQKVYENPIQKGWDGRDQKGNNCTQGVYLYRIHIISIQNETYTKSGTVTLLR